MCSAGRSCQFSHDISEQPRCRYYAKGTCKYGANCGLSHDFDPSVPSSGGGSANGAGRAKSSPIPAAPAAYRPPAATADDGVDDWPPPSSSLANDSPLSKARRGE